MWRFIIFLLIVIASVWAGIKIAEDPGYVLLVYRHWSVEMPLWFTALCVIIIFFLLYFLMRFINGIQNSIFRWKNWLRWRRKSKSYSKTNHGLVNLIEGDWRVAEKNLLSGISQSDAPLINYLGAAKAAHEEKNFNKRDEYLLKAHEIAPQDEMAIGIVEAELQYEQGHYEEAKATLSHLHSLDSRQPLVLKRLERLYVHLGDWANLLKIIPDLRKTKVILVEYTDLLEVKVYQELLKNTPAVNEVWNSIPRKFQKNPDVIYCYVNRLLEVSGSSAEAESLIQKTVAKFWHEGLVRLYGLLKTSNSTKQLIIAEGWLKHYGKQHAILFLTLARICVRCQLWGKARSYFEESLHLKPYRETYIEYGKLLEHLGETSAAMQVYREGLSTSEDTRGHAKNA